MKIVFTVFFIFLSANLISQPVEEWVRRYNGPGNSFDIVSKLLLGKNDNVFVYGSGNGKGSLYDFTVINYDSKGNTKWTETYNGPGNSSDNIISACIDAQNNSYVTGFTTDTSFVSNVTTAKFDSSGNMIWLKEYKNPVFSHGYGVDIALDYTGNINVCGAGMFISSGNYTSLILKYSADGNLLGSFIFDTSGTTSNIPVKIKITSSNKIIVSGTSENISGSRDMYVSMLNDLNGIFRTVVINGSSDQDDDLSDMVLDNENNIYICGSMRNISSSVDYYYAKLDTACKIIWSGVFNGTGNDTDIPYKLFNDSERNTYITGYSRNSNFTGSEDMLTLKISGSGNLLWSRVYNGPENGIDQGFSVVTDDEGNVYVGGGSDRKINDLIYMLLKYDANGNLLWTKNYFYNALSEDFIYDIKLDAANNIYVTGISIGQGSSFDFATIKYSQTTGIIPVSDIFPDNFILYQNYPNPFNPSTNLEFGISKLEFVSLKVYDLLGNEIKTLVNEVLPAGSYKIKFDSSGLSSGVYFYALTAGNFTDKKKMIILK